jgi:ribonuclease P protein component
MGEATVPAEQPASRQKARISAPDVDAGRPGHPANPSAEGPGSSFRLIWRVRDRATFTEFRRGRRGRQGPLSVVICLANPSTGHPPRVAYAVGRSVGSAVVRNRVRRRLRTLVPELRLAPGAYLIEAGPGAGQAAEAELRQCLVGAIATAMAPEQSSRARSNAR